LWLYSSTPLPGAYFVPAVDSARPVGRLGAIVGRQR
jgi:hypothetical protein